MTEIPQLDLTMTPKSEAQWNNLAAQVAKSRDQVIALKNELKKVDTYIRGLNAQQIKIQGSGDYVRGKEAQGSQRVRKTIREGTDLGRGNAEAKELLRTARENVAVDKARLQLQAAQNLSVEKERRSVSQLLDQKKLLEARSRAEIRMGLMREQGMQAEAEQAKALVQLIDRRLAKVKQLNAAQAEANREAAKATAEQARADKRAATAQAREASRPERFAQRRRDQAEYLNGDGGAHIMGVQASLMGNYMAIGAGMAALTGTGRFIKDLDEALHNLQAIVVVTDNDMTSLKSTILEVAENTKFYSTELADAAVNMGQAGLSAREIEDSLEGVALLASATGTDLGQSVDIMTSVLGVFNKSADQTGQIANTITQAVNDSKLSIDKLTLGLQYAGNTAAQSGVSFEELVAALGAISNAGIRSGSTMGTGLRQIMISFQKPSKAFQENLAKLGLSMADVDLRSNGLAGAMQNLEKAGFSASDAIRSFEVRAAAAYTALASQIGTMRDLEEAFINSNAAIVANDTQMKSLANRGRQLLSSLQTVAANGLEPWVAALSSVTSGLTSLVQSMGPAIGALMLFGSAWGALRIISKVTLLMGSFAGVTGKTAAGAAAAAAATNQLAVATTRLQRATALLGGPWSVGIALATTLGLELFGMTKKSKDLGDEIDTLRSKFDQAAGDMKSTRQAMSQVGDRISDLKNKAASLKDERLDLEAEKIRQEFEEMGLVLPNTVQNVQELITALTNLRAELAEDYILNIRIAQEALGDLITANSQKVAVDSRSLQVDTRRLSGRAERLDGPSAGTDEMTNLMQALRSMDRGLQGDNLNDKGMTADILRNMGDALEGVGELDLSRSEEGVVEDIRELFRRYQDVVQDGRELAKQRSQYERGEQEETGARVASQNPDLESRVRLLNSNVADTFRPALDIGLDPGAQLDLMGQLREKLADDVEALEDEIKQQFDKAEQITPGSGPTAVMDLNKILNEAAAAGMQAYEDTIGTVIGSLEASLEDTEADNAAILSDMDRTIEAEKDPTKELALREARRQFVAQVAADQDAVYAQLAEAYRQAGDEEKARSYQNRRIAAASTQADTDAGYRADSAKMVQDQLEGSLDTAMDMISAHDTATAQQVDRLQMAIEAEDLPGRQNELLESFAAYTVSRAEERQALLDAALRAADAAGDTKKAAEIRDAMIDLDTKTQQALLVLGGKIGENDKTLSQVALTQAIDRLENYQDQSGFEETRLRAAIDRETYNGRQNDLLKDLATSIANGAEEKRVLLEGVKAAAEAAGDYERADEMARELRDLEVATADALLGISDQIGSNEAESRRTALEQANQRLTNHQEETARQVARLDAQYDAEKNPLQRNVLLEQMEALVARRALQEQTLAAQVQAAADAAGDFQQAADIGAGITDLEFNTEEALRGLADMAEANTGEDRDTQIQRLRDVLSQSDAEYDSRAVDLETDLAELPRGEFDARLETVEALAQNQADKILTQVGIMDQIIALLREDPSEESQAEADALEADAAGLMQELDTNANQFAEDQKAIQIEQLEDHMLGLNMIRERALRLMELAKTAEEVAKHKNDAVQALIQMMDTGEDIGELKGFTPTEMTEVQHDFEGQIADVEEAAVSRNKAIVKENKGGGKKEKKGKKEKSQQEIWIDSQQSLIESQKSLNDRGMIGPQAMADTINTTAMEAEKRLAGVDKQLLALSDKMRDGKLSEAEMEKVTDLMKEQKGLLDLMEVSYDNIGAQLIMNGDYQAGAEVILKEWAKDAMDMDKALQDGLINTLNTAVSSLATFFKTAVNEPKNIGQAFRDMGMAVIGSIQDMIAQMLAMQAVMWAIKSLNQAFGWGLTLPGAGMAQGGEVKERNHGTQLGHVRRFALGGMPNRDSQLINAQPGEYIMRKSAVDAIGKDSLDEMNARGNAVVARGKPVQREEKEAKDSTINFYLVDERSAAGSVGPQDILAVVSDDISRGGVTKRLIKSVQMGHI